MARSVIKSISVAAKDITDSERDTKENTVIIQYNVLLGDGKGAVTSERWMQPKNLASLGKEMAIINKFVPDAQVGLTVDGLMNLSALTEDQLAKVPIEVNESKGTTYVSLVDIKTTDDEKRAAFAKGLSMIGVKSAPANGGTADSSSARRPQG